MALGTPAVVSDRGALPEIAGAPGAVVSPLKEKAFAQAVSNLLLDGRLYEEKANGGKAQVLKTTWIDYVRRLARVYEGFL